MYWREEMMKIGMIGAGAIGTYVLDKIRDEKNLEVRSILVRNEEKYKQFEDKYGVNLYTDFEEFIQSDIDIVVEAANVETAKQWLPQILKQKDAVIISIGALADEAYNTKINEILEVSGHQLYLPSGAIGGLDFIQNIKAAGLLKEVTIETRKPAHTLVDEKITEEKIVFEGPAKEAIKQYPKNVNVSIALSLAGIGLNETKVVLVADPNVTENSHTIKVLGETGIATFNMSNKPLPTNPKSSYQAAVSILGTLKKIVQPIKVG